MPRWIKKLNNLADKVSDSIIEKVQEQVEEKLGSLSSQDASRTVSKLKATAASCHDKARATGEICRQTADKRQQMIDFAQEIQSTLGNLKDASVIETIKELTDGQRIAGAIELAKGLDDTALTCVNKSIEMIDELENGMDSLPPLVKQAIDHASGADELPDEDGDGVPDHELLKNIDKDIADVQSCVASLKELNLATAFKVGLQAFTHLTEKAKVSRAMFDQVETFSKDVEEITGAFNSMDVRAIASKAKDLLRCLRATDVMRHLALAAKKLIQMLIELFQATAERISVLWKALAFAKDCMTDCVEHVKEAKARCLEACDKSTALIEKSRGIKLQLEKAGSINMKSINAVRDLSDGDEIKDAINLAQNMDDLVIDCTGKVTSMVDRVVEGFKSLPDILTAGIDMKEQGKAEDDPEPVDLEMDVAELEQAHKALEESNVIDAARAGARGFSGVSDKSSLSRDQLTIIQGFAEKCSKTIDAFMGSWDLESLAGKIVEMCRLVSLGELMKQFASQIKRLVVAMVKLMKASVDKFSKLDIKDIAGDVGEKIQDKLEDLKVGDAIEKAKDKLDDIKGKFKFWK